MEPLTTMYIIEKILLYVDESVSRHSMTLTHCVYLVVLFVMTSKQYLQITCMLMVHSIHLIVNALQLDFVKGLQQRLQTTVAFFNQKDFSKPKAGHRSIIIKKI